MTPRKITCCVFHFLCRISPKSRDGRPNPEEPVDEDEDVQAERIRTATALTISTEEVEKQATEWVLAELFEGGQEWGLICWVLFRKFAVWCIHVILKHAGASSEGPGCSENTNHSGFIFLRKVGLDM